MGKVIDLFPEDERGGGIMRCEHFPEAICRSCFEDAMATAVSGALFLAAEILPSTRAWSEFPPETIEAIKLELLGLAAHVCENPHPEFYREPPTG